MIAFPLKLLAPPQPTATLTVQTKIDGAAVQRRISIYDRITQSLLWHSFTDTTGEITRILPLRYSTTDYLAIAAYDDTGTYNAVIADNAQTEMVT